MWNALLDFCRSRCVYRCYCGLEVSDRLRFYEHARDAHALSVAEYRKTKGNPELVRRELHECGICGENVSWDPTLVRIHLARKHSNQDANEEEPMSIEQYFVSYVYTKVSQSENDGSEKEDEGQESEKAEPNEIVEEPREDKDGEEVIAESVVEAEEARVSLPEEGEEEDKDATVGDDEIAMLLDDDDLFPARPNSVRLLEYPPLAATYDKYALSD